MSSTDDLRRQLLLDGLAWRIQRFYLQTMADYPSAQPGTQTWQAVKFDARRVVIEPLRVEGIVEEVMFDVTIRASGDLYVAVEATLPEDFEKRAAPLQRQIEALERRLTATQQALVNLSVGHPERIDADALRKSGRS